MSSQMSIVIESFSDTCLGDLLAEDLSQWAPTLPPGKMAGIDILIGQDADVSKKRTSPVKTVTKFRVEADLDYAQDLETLDRPYYLAPIFKATDELKHQALTRTRNRKPLDEPLVWCLEATWEARVGLHKRDVAFRVLYRVDGQNVRLLRLLLKEGNRFIPVRKTETDLAAEAEEGGGS